MDIVEKRRANLRKWFTGKSLPPKEKSYLSQLMGGKTSFGEKAARRLEKTYDMPIGWLDSDADDDQLPTGAIPYVATRRRVWVIGNGQGGIPNRIWGDSDYPAGASDKYAEVATEDPHAFIISVRGDSMEPRFMEGEYALVSPSAEANPKHDVLVRLKSGETLLKRLLDLRGGVRLTSYNNADVLTYPFEEIVWIYRVLHALPECSIRIDADQLEGHDYETVRVHERRLTQQPAVAAANDRRKKHA